MQIMLSEAEDALRAAEARFQRDNDFPLTPHTIAVMKTGSHAYGTNTETSDNDYMAIVLPRMRHIVGLGGFSHFEPGKDDQLDLKAMSVKKFVMLAMEGNPNVVEMLFFRPEQYLYVAPAFQRLLDHKHSFLSRQVFDRFSGYAFGQSKKMTSGLKDREMSVERKAWVDKIGYDPKDASHLIRLLYTGKRLARTSQLVPHMNDFERRIVTEIKQGKWKLDEVKDFAEFLGQKADDSMLVNGVLPSQPDRDFIEILLMEIHREAVR